MEEGIGQPSSFHLNNRKSGIRNMEEPLLTKKEVAEYLKVSTRTVDRLIVLLEIPVFVVGRQIRIPESSLKLMMKRNSMTAKERNNVINKIYGG
jgi:excisionase family DNA binding protein|tara:strand:+ start:375 stop:656 length:282 start_codon:yes stop_codon:yes gene_type:complete